MAFTFRFQSVLNYRRHQAEIAEMELAKARLQLALAEQHLATLRARRQDGESRLAHCLQKGVMGPKLQMWRLYLTDIERKIAEEVQKTEAMRFEAADLRCRLLEANRKKKTMEKLLEREEKVWRQEENQRQEKELSEVAVRLHARRSS